MFKKLPIFIITFFTYIQSFAQCPPLTARKLMASSFHSSIIITHDSIVRYWGDNASLSPIGDDQLIPATLPKTSYGGASAVAISVAAGSVGASDAHQLFLHSTTGIYGWGRSANTIVSGTSTGVVGVTNIALPSGVSIGDVSFIEAAGGGLCLVTNSGALWVRKGNNAGGPGQIYGDGSTTIDAAGATTWHNVLTAAATPLTNVIRVSMSGRAMMALTSSGDMYVWGEGTFLGNGTAAATRAFATLVSNSTGTVPKDVNINSQTSGENAAQYFLGTDGRLYGVGENQRGNLGQGTTTDATSWVTVKGAGGTGVLENIILIGSNNPYQGVATNNYSIGALNSSGDLFLWGDNNSDMIGGDTISSPTKDSAFYTVPRIPPNFSFNNSAIGYFEMGGHTTAAFQASTSKFCYVGHTIRGSMGDGISTSGTRKSFDCINTPGEYVCPPAPNVGCPAPSANDIFASSVHASLVLNGIPSVSFWGEASSSAEPGVNIPSPLTLFEYNGVPKGVAASGIATTPSSQATQMWLLTDEGIWGWGYSANTIFSDRSGPVPIAELALPSGVSASQVSFIRSSRGGIALVTNTGNVWVRAGIGSSCSPLVYGDGSATLDAASSTAWHQVTTAPGVPLAGVLELSFAGTTALAITATQAYVWGANTYLGDGTAAANRNRATLMTLPVGVSPRSAEIIQAGALEAAQFILGKNNKIYCLGRNANGVLGKSIASTTTILTAWDSLSLVGIRKMSSNNPFANGVYSIGAITVLGDVYLWGANDNNRIGFTSTADVTTPTAATTVPSGDAANFDIGGNHTIIFSKTSSQFYFAGRYVGGSRGDGVTTTGTNTNFALAGTVINCANTAFNLSGNLYYDNNGLTDNLVNGLATDSIGTKPMNVNLLDEGGYVIATTPITSSGSYTFSTVPFGNYFVQVSPTAGTIFALAPTTSLEIGYINVGEQIGTVAGVNVDATADGKILVPLSENLTNVNFGIAPLPPVSNNIAATRMNNTSVATAIPQLQASNPLGVLIANYTVSTIPPASEGVLYYCASAPASCTIASLSPVTAGLTLSLAQSESLYFDPSASFTGNSSFTYFATDANGMISNTATYNLPIYNNPPISISARTAQIIDTTDRFYLPELIGGDKDGTIASYTISSIPGAGGVLSYCNTGDIPCSGSFVTITGTTNLTPAQALTLEFDPTTGFTGDFTFNFTATDNNGNVSNISQFTIPVVSGAGLGGNLPPVATNVIAQNINNTSGATRIPNLLGTDPDGSVVEYTIGASIPNVLTEGSLTYCVTPPSTGCGTAVTAGQTLTPVQALTLSFDPLPTFLGNASFTYTATDDAGVPLTSAPATYTIPVVNNPPVANPDRVSPISNTLTTATRLPSLSGSDYDGTIVSYNITSVPPAGSGTLQYCATGSLPGCTPTSITGPLSSLTPAQVATLSFIPNSSFSGDYVFYFTVVDNNSQVSSSAAFTIPVVGGSYGVGEPPIAFSHNAPAINSSSVASLPTALSALDPDGTIASFTITSVTPANEGTLTYCSTGTLPSCTPSTLVLGQTLTTAQAATITFTPNANFVGTSTFNYVATDNDGNISNTATVTIPVLNEPPVANNLTNSVISRFASATTLNPLSSSDADGTVVNYTILSLPSAEEGLLSVCTTAPSTGCTPVTLGQVLTPTQVTQLAFTPNDTNHSPIVTFLYSTNDNSGLISNIAAATIPLFDAAPLPMTLLDFVANKQTENALLTWKTGVETEGLKFTLEHSTSAQQWTTIHTEYASAKSQYRYLHKNVVLGNNFYRLKLVDATQKIQYSPVRLLVFEQAGQNTVGMYPNPVTNQFVISTSNSSSIAQLEVYSNEGKLLMRFSNLKSGSSVDMGNLASGVYLVKITDGNGETQNTRITKL